MKRISWLQRRLAKLSPGIDCTMEDGCVHLTGEVADYALVLQAGKLATACKSVGVVNDLVVPGLKETPMRTPSVEDASLEGRHIDVLVIGAGVVGCAIAKELSKNSLSILVVDKEYDVAVRTSSRNDGMIHPGIDIHPGLLKAHYNSRGNRLYTDLSQELGFPFKRIGSYVVFDKWWHRLTVPVFKHRGRLNGVDGVEFIGRKELFKRQPEVAAWQKGAMYFPSCGITSPYLATVAFAENAIMNGAEFSLETVVTGMEVRDGKIQCVETNRGTVYPRTVVNAAGVYCDRIAEMAQDRFFSIHPRKGTEAILDSKAANLTDSSIAKVPFSDVKKHTKGGGVMRTIDGNILVGPDAVETIEREDDSTDADDIHAMFTKHRFTVPNLRESDIITYFSGTRACTYEEDFVISKGRKTKNIVHAAGIQSPGLTAAPAIAEDIAKLVCEVLLRETGKAIEKNQGFNPVRESPVVVSRLPLEQRAELIRKHPEYGRIVCRCEQVSEGEILDALRSPLPVYSVDAVKRRCRPGMGRCQGGFCSPVVATLIAKEAGIALEAVTKAGSSSPLLGPKDKTGMKFSEASLSREAFHD